MEIQQKKRVENSLRVLYKEDKIVCETMEKIVRKLDGRRGEGRKKAWLTENDSILITYGDSLTDPKAPGLRVLGNFLDKYVGDGVSCIHILPMFPFSSDDGFSIVDYEKIRLELGSWDDVKRISEHYDLMIDAVINHVSTRSVWFQKFLRCEKPYSKYFITADPGVDYSSVIRPRPSPLLTPFRTKEGVKYVWTTFSADQVDLNYRNPDVLVDMLGVLMFYAAHGARYLRLDAVGFVWKEPGTSCMHLKETHEIVRLIRTVLEIYAPDVIILTETNVPQPENVSYFGNGFDEAHLVYQFPLPPLVMFSILKGSAAKLTRWAKGIKPVSPETTYFNFLSSHDGIGIRPAEGILSSDERAFLAEAAMRNGGSVSYKDNGDGTRSVYELNINYQDALASPEVSDGVRIRRFLAAETILLTLQGVPGIYVHSLLGSRNDYYDRAVSGIPRKINRESLDAGALEEALGSDTNRKRIFTELIRRLRIRRGHTAFSPAADQEILSVDDRVFAVKRTNRSRGEIIFALINVSGEKVALNLEQTAGTDLLSGKSVCGGIVLEAYGAVWIAEEQ